jgi:RNA polymerase sigma-70 factor (ECF subfamily)
VPNDPATDNAQLLALQQGDATALNRLITRWQRPLHSFAFRYCQNRTDAEDLVAQTFARLYQQRYRLRPDTKLSAWLFTTLTNFCHNLHRWKRRHPTMTMDSPIGGGLDEFTTDFTQYDLPSEIPNPKQSLEQDESVAAVRAAINQLPHDLKVTLLLHHYDRLSYREIGQITGCSERGVETRLYRARQRLREKLAGLMQQTAVC